jgi:hypothetical protein
MGTSDFQGGMLQKVREKTKGTELEEEITLHKCELLRNMDKQNNSRSASNFKDMPHNFEIIIKFQHSTDNL